MSIRSRGAVALVVSVVAVFATASCSSSNSGLSASKSPASSLTPLETTANPVSPTSHIALPSSPAELSFREVYRSDVPSAEPLTTDPTGSPQPSATDLSTYAELDCSLPANHTERSAADVATRFLAACGAPDGSPIWYKFLLYPATITSHDLATVKAEASGMSDGTWAVSLVFTSAGAKVWAKFTGSHLNNAMAIVINGRVFSEEVIQSEIVGPTMIEGRLDQHDAEALASAIRPLHPGS